ncbi:ABC transporter substrate-binding protein [Chelatococcus reniformis]|uniref:Branched-chain amino acid ABC transporter substrate-binding protein n=1 Tax=Chelatococcus reniformis TaxID=1494448 RepID=A0A916XK57_9HYPH|nr:ABC transporter substrate-binding protein [Chelatococcus reniformis]GGC80478.1 branched-chain amino acid ABC transporter substrate-binding protein [Chelatococcus reniformis]
MRDVSRRHACLAAALGGLLALLAGAPAHAQKTYDPGASDAEIKFGQTMPYSGPASSYGVIGKTQAAYFQMLNDQGGINGRKLKLISYDDGYSPPKTVEQIRKLVESDEVLFTFQTLGTAPNAAVQKYLNQKKVPQLFVSTGATRFSDPKNFPWTMGWNPTYLTEGRIYGRYIQQNHPGAKIAILYQNDDFGREVIAGVREGLGAGAAKQIIAEASYEATDPTVDSQMVKLKSSGADLFLNITTPKFAAQAIRKAGELGWKPVHILSVNSVSVGQVMQPAGFENAQGVLSVSYLKDYTDPTWKDDPGVKKWITFMDKYMPDADKNNAVYFYGYATAQTLEHVLRQAGDDLTRANIMRQATNLKNVQLDLFLPGMSINTSPTDYLVIEQLRMMRFDKDRWEPFGPLIDSETTAN